MELRPHQELAVNMLRDSLKRGNKRPILAAPCSFGKTITALHMLQCAAEKGKRGIFICDRIKLVQQSLESADFHGLDVGVIQSNHERTNWNAPIQIASIHTMARKSKMIEFDFAIVDECHIVYESMKRYMEAYNNVPFIGLSATPYAKELGKYYDDLVVPISPRQLLDQQYLCPVDYYGGRQVQTKGVKSKALRTGGTDWDEKALSDAIEKDDTLAGDIVKNWFKHAQGKQTIAFSPSIKHSKHMVELFLSHGIPAVHIDGYMDDEERQWIFRAHDKGEFKILSCSRLLNTGYDAPQVECLIDCFPTKSLEPKVKQCPQCYQEMVGIRCKCGYEVPMKERLQTDNQELQKITKATKEDKSEWLGQFQLYAAQKRYQAGYAAHLYRQKFGVWPKVQPTQAKAVSEDVMNFIKYTWIKRAKGNARSVSRAA
jgi:DNA repair protein RadD